MEIGRSFAVSILVFMRTELGLAKVITFCSLSHRGLAESVGLLAHALAIELEAGRARVSGSTGNSLGIKLDSPFIRREAGSVRSVPSGVGLLR